MIARRTDATDALVNRRVRTITVAVVAALIVALDLFRPADTFGVA